MQGRFLGFIVGVCVVHASPALVSAPSLISLLALAALTVKRAPVVFATIAGFLLSTLTADVLLDNRWRGAPGAERTVTGTVGSLADIDADGARFLFLPDRAQHPDLPRRIRVGWYLDEAPPRPGSRWRLTLRLRQPRGSLNPGAFDYERWLTAARIGATATVRPFPPPAWLTASPAQSLTTARAMLDDAIARALPAHPRRGIIRGLVLGERTELDARAWEVFARTGTAHLMAISGLHVGMVAALGLGVGAWFARRLRYTADHAREIGVVVGFTVAAAYAALAGFAVPTRRALCMLAAAAFILMARRHRNAVAAWLLAMFVIVALDTLAPLTIGFWLSFAAVAFITWRLSHRRAAPGPLLQLARVQWAVTIGLLPLTLWFFQRGSLVAPLTNLVAVPLFTLAIVPAALLGTALAIVAPAMGTAWLAVLAVVLDAAWWWLGSVADWGWAQRFTPKPPFWTVVCAFAGGGVLLAPAGWPGRAVVGIALCAPMLVWQPTPPAPGAWRLTVLDVGQGLAAVVRTPDRTLVYDTGPRFGSTSDAGSRVVVPYLRAHGIQRIDRLVISHAHSDHDGGVAAVRDAFPGAQVIAGDPDRLAQPVAQCAAGQRWQWGGIDFRLLHPLATTHGAPNLNSCVLHVSGAGGAALLPGDIEWPVELTLAAPGSALRPAEIVIAPHHGSRTSSIGRFVTRTRPRWVVFPASFGNRWGFPHPEVVARWENAGARTSVIGQDGAVTFDADPVAGIGEPVMERVIQRAWWRVE
ncbi:MAG: DNA internalization-related competence protein ComEC/Rec2 [Gammaproteobacteria bacterium]